MLWVSVSTRGFALTSRANGFAWIFFSIFSQRNSSSGIGPMIPKMISRRHQKHGYRTGHRDRMQDRYVAIAVHQRRYRPGATVECHTILLDVDVPFVVKNK